VQKKGAVVLAIEQVMAAQSTEEMTEQFMWQQKKGKDKKDDFKTELLSSGSPDIKVCAFVQNGSNIVKVVHGLHKYYGNAAKEYCNTVLGRMGEWTDEAHPITIAMPDKAAWDWMDVAVNTEVVAWANHVTASDGSMKPWAPATQPTTVAVPRMLHVPPVVAKYLIEGERSAFELHKFCGELTRGDDAALKDEHVEMMKNWALAAGQYATGTTSHKVAIDVSPVTNVSPPFIIWLRRQAETYLTNPTAQVSPQAQQQVQQQPQLQMASTDVFMQSMSQMLAKLTEKQAESTAEPDKKSVLGKGLTPYQVAALCGFCHITDPRERPELYKIMMNCSNKAEVRANIIRLMEDWAFVNRRQIDKGFYIPDDIITSIMNVTPNPTGTVATPVPSDRIVSCLICLPRRMDQVEKMMQHDRLVEETKANRTYKDAEKLCKSDVRAPPSTYERLKGMITTTECFMTVLYGPKCPLVIGCHKMWEQLETTEAFVLQSDYDAQYCAEVCWAMFDDARSFFAKPLMPDDLLRDNIKWPKSRLADVVVDIGFQRNVYRVNFPASWKTKVEKKDTYTARQQQDEPKDTSEEKKAVYVKRNAFKDFIEHGDGPPSSSDNGIHQLHPKFKLALKKYHDTNKGEINIVQIMEHAKIQWRDLPTLQGHYNKKTNKCTTCWPHMLGECRFGDKCHFAKYHVPGKRVPDNYADDVLAVIQPGIEAMVDGNILAKSNKKPRA
jgi:hypothetical protein